MRGRSGEELDAIYSYTYGDSMWGDLLTRFDGTTITYDEIGNPKTYYGGRSFVWQNGRQLATYKLNGTTQATYTYNADGVRTSKTASGTTHTYTLSGSTIMREELSSGIALTYLYDESGKRYGVRYQKGTATPRYFYYLYNGQGDVIEIVNSSGATVALYIYDAWGKASVTDASGLAITSTVHIGNVNPFRYRGYYYDQETGFYYLNSRYYDPQTGRFINADAYISTGQGVLGNNMFAYCQNNPVHRLDPTGQFLVEQAGMGGGMGSGSGYAMAQAMADALGITATIGAATLATGMATAALRQEMFYLRRTKAREKAEDITESKTVPIPPQGQTYYHVTSTQNATQIISTGTITAGEGGYVYAWRLLPSKQAINNSGARYSGSGSVVVAFETIAAFEMDPTINPATYAYGPVRTCFPGSIKVSNARIVRYN